LLKLALKGIAAASLLFLLAWISTYVYWQHRIQKALRSFEARAETMSDRWEGEVMTQEAHDTFEAAGCRGLPSLVNALATSQNLKFLQAVTFQLTLTMGESSALEFLKGCRIRTEDSLSVREEKCGRLRTWWKDKGSRYHRWWCVWSRRCEAPLSK
jgi:hypothetical protein